VLFRQLFDKTSSTYTYLLAEKPGGIAILIDPVLEQLDLYQRLINELQLTLSACLETHLHADHITASGLLQQLYSAEIIMGEPTAAQGKIRRIKDQDRLDFGRLSMTALATPGHTDDSYCFLMSDRVFTGDTLFIRGTGRTDFQNGDSKQAYDSLFNKLLILPDHTFVYPGHDYKGQTVSTIGEEKQFNPRLQVQNANEYANIMDQLNLSAPQKIQVAVPANLHCGVTRSQQEKL
jgi:sulfur dioxygenase